MNVLAIGNSFSEDATRYLHAIAKADGEILNVANLYIGGCTLERHYRNMLSGERVYELQYNGEKTGFSVSLSEALLNRKWDVITIQQASALSFIPDSYEPYLTELVAFIRKCAPKAKFYLHETWFYEDGSEKLTNLKRFESPEEMLNAIIPAYESAAKNHGLDGMIRSGELFMELSKRYGFKLHRDGFHATYGLGRYALALIWYKTLAGKGVKDNTFALFDEPVTREAIRVIKKTVDSL